MGEPHQRIWIEAGDECPYFYEESELADVGSPVTEYIRADLCHCPALEPSAAREQALHEAARNLINELSGNPGELIDKMAEAIRDWGSHYDDGPWETLPDDRKAGWRGDAERALAVVKEYLTARRPSEQAVTEAMELARAVLAQSITAGHNVPGPTPEDIEKAFWALDAALKSAMEAGR